jgi:hypothetical protein
MAVDRQLIADVADLRFASGMGNEHFWRTANMCEHCSAMFRRTFSMAYYFLVFAVFINTIDPKQTL